MNCTNCGKESTEGALYCTGCGGRLDSAGNSTDAVLTRNEECDNEMITHEENTSLGNENQDDSESASINRADPKEINNDTDGLDSSVGCLTDNIHEGDIAQRSAYDDMYCNRAASVTDAVKQNEQTKRRNKPLNTWSFFWRDVVCMIPVVNIIVLFVLAFAEGININSRSYARAKLIRYLIFTIIFVGIVILWFIFARQIANWMAHTITMLYEYLNS